MRDGETLLKPILESSLLRPKGRARGPREARARSFVNFDYGKELGTPASTLLNGMQFVVAAEQVPSAIPFAMLAHELQPGVASGAQEVPASPASPPLLPLLELEPPLLELELLELLVPLLEPEPLPELLAPLEPGASSPESMPVTGVLFEPLSHATAAAMPEIATRASPPSFNRVDFEFITGPRSSRSGKLWWRRCTWWLRSQPCTRRS
jgi:hypothetical protein